MPIISTADAFKKLNSGDVVSLPTETVYGLAGSIFKSQAIEKIFIVKQRPSFDPLIVHVANESQAKSLCADWTEIHSLLCQNFWPGPLTIVAPKNKNKVSDVITAGFDTVALRSPNHSMFLKVLEELKEPLAAPSANLFSHTSPTLPDHVEVAFRGSIDIVDGGPCQVGVESTICYIKNCDFPQKSCNIEILRHGMITGPMIQEKLLQCGWTANVEFKKNNAMPGQSPAHYRPSKPLFLIHSLDGKDSWQKFLYQSNFVDSEIQWLKLADSPQLAARNLYTDLRYLSSEPGKAIACVWESEEKTSDEWNAIWDRLSRAAVQTF